jgi:hypothetical protein
METNTWYSSSSQKDYDELFREIKNALTQKGWKIESYQNTAEALTNSNRIFPQGLSQKNDTEILIIRPDKLEIISNSQTVPLIPVLITEFSNETVVSTIGLNTFDSMCDTVDEQAAKAIWNQLIEVIEGATVPASTDNQ